MAVNLTLFMGVKTSTKSFFATNLVAALPLETLEEEITAIRNVMCLELLRFKPTTFGLENQ